MLSNFRAVSAEWENQHYPVPSLDEESEMFGTYARNVIAGQGRYVPDRGEQPIPTVDLKYCEYDKNRKVLKMASEYFGMPSKFYVKSHHTGKTVAFVAVGEHDVLFDEDGWDGEQQIYRPVGNVPGVDHMVIYHQW
jgi:hypothetical protein